jgi:hypothetical protein
MMSSNTTTVSPRGPEAGRRAGSENLGLLGTLDQQIMRHQSAISLATGILAILGVGAIVLGAMRVSPDLKVLLPF